MTRIVFWLAAWLAFGKMLLVFAAIVAGYLLFEAGRWHERRRQARELDAQLEALVAGSPEAELDSIPF